MLSGSYIDRGLASCLIKSTNLIHAFFPRQHLAKVAEKQKNPDLALRVAVEPGGCHGYQYKMEITNEIEEDDFRFSSGDNVHLVIDSTSLRLIKGSTIDYVTELIGSQFAILNNPQAKGAGCGCGVSWEPII